MMNHEPKASTDQYAKAAENLQREIEETRSAIGDDLKALGEKLNPEHLKAGALEVVNEVKEGAKEVLRDAKEAAADSIRHAKDQAVGAVSETVGELRDEARRVTRATTEFASSNAVPLALLGIGAGWLMLSLRRQKAQARVFAWDETRASPRWTHSNRRPPAQQREDSYVDSVRDKVSELGEQTLSKAQEIGETALRVSRDVSADARQQLQRGRQGVATFARENPLAVGAAVVAAGVGVGLLLPATNAENHWMGEARDQLLRDTKEAAGELRQATERVTRTAREAAQEVRSLAQSS